MKRIFTVIFLIITIFFQFNLFAQKKKSDTEKNNYEIIFHIKGATDSVIFLAIHYKGQLYLKDSAVVAQKEKYIFKGEKRLDDGLYTLVSYKRTPYLDFILDKNQYFEYTLDTTMNPANFSVKNSPQNSEMLAFQVQTTKARGKSREFIEKIEKFEEEANTDSTEYYKNQLDNLDKEMKAYINELILRNPDYLFSKLQRAYQQIEIPAPPLKADGTIDSSFQMIYYRTHYWDNVDLSDGRMIYLPVLEPKYNDYIKKVLLYAEADTIIRYVDMFLEKTKADNLMYRYFLDRLTTDFQKSDLGYDAVFVHLVKENHLKGKVTWMDDDLLGKFRKRAQDLEKTLIGRKAPELIMPDTAGLRWISTHTLPYKYVILWFYDPTCQTCKRESSKLKHLYDSLELAGTRNFEVYGVGNDKDVERWKRYVREQQFPWVNVGGFTANIDYQDAYNVTSNPTMFILNEDREIILNKRIEIEMIPLFLEQYERIKKGRK